MTISITIDLSDSDVDHFQQALVRARDLSADKSAESITDAARKLLIVASKTEVPDFIAQRLAKLESLISMVHDEGWALPEADRSRVLTALMYFADPADVIPDSIPVVGYLDDAIMIELCVRELKHEVESYEDFNDYRKHEAQSRGVDPYQLGRADWLEDRRQELQDRMRRRRDRDGYRSRTGESGLFRFG